MLPSAQTIVSYPVDMNFVYGEFTEKTPHNLGKIGQKAP